MKRSPIFAPVILVALLLLSACAVPMADSGEAMAAPTTMAEETMKEMATAEPMAEDVKEATAEPMAEEEMKATAEPMAEEMMADGMMTHTFRVRIENISGDSGLPTPFAPGVWLLHKESAPLFSNGLPDRGLGLEALAEDGNPGPLAAAEEKMMMDMGMEHTSGIFNTPVGADAPGPLLPGSAYEFEVTATSETPYLSFATMLVQSNDLFVAPSEMGIALFDGDGMAMEMMELTAEVLLWDAGTEANEEAGSGPNQAPRQAGPNTGPADDNSNVRLVDDGAGYPAVSALLRVTIEPVLMEDSK